MSKKQASEFTKQLSAFVENNSVTTPENWIGTITNTSTDYMTCDVKIEGKGAICDVPAFGVPIVGSSAIILFMNSSYSQPVALCNSINTLDQDKVDIIKSQGAANFHSNGDFSNGDTGYTGKYFLDKSVTTGEIFFEVKLGTLELNNEKSNSVSSKDDTYSMSLEVGDLKDDGVITSVVTATRVSNGSLAEGKIATVKIFGEKHTRTLDNHGQITYNYMPTAPYTKHGYSVILPYKGYYGLNVESYIEFTCDITDKDAINSFFKVQAYYRSKGSQLRIKVVDADTEKSMTNLPESVGTKTQIWNATGNTWKVNREIFKKADHKNIKVTISNIGEENVRLDGLLVWDESADTDFYNSKEDLING